MASPSSSAVSALAGGLLVEHSGWHAVFWVNVPIAVLAAALTLAGVPESADTAGKRINVPGATLVTAGLVLAVAGFARAVRHPWTDRWTLALLIAAAAPLTAFSAQQLRAASPLAPVGWLAARGILVAVTTLLLASFAPPGHAGPTARPGRAQLLRAVRASMPSPAPGHGPSERVVGDALPAGLANGCSGIGRGIPCRR